MRPRERPLSVPSTDNSPDSSIAVPRLCLFGPGELTVAASGESRVEPLQPKRLALLAYLAIARPRGFHRRDTIVGMFWPELAEPRARHALRQAIHDFRRSLGHATIENRGDEELAIAPGAIWCDVPAFEVALESRLYEEAIQLYRGRLLEGLNVSTGSSAFERWLEAERARLSAGAAGAAWSLSVAAERQGDVDSARRWARQAAALSPDDEESQRKLISVLDRSGDRSGALRAYEELAQNLATEFESEPSAETKNLIGLVRSRTRAHPGKTVELDSVSESPAPIVDRAAGYSVAASDEADSARGSREQDRGTRHRFNRVGVAALATAVLAAAGYGWLTRGDAKAGQLVPTIAVGSVVESGPGADSSGQSGTLREILATDLARIEGLNVVSQSRMYDVLAQISKRADSPGALAEAAKIAGAGEIIEGTLYRRDGDGSRLRVDLRRVNLASGVVVSAHSASGSDLFALVDSVTFDLAAALRLARPDHALSSATSTSLVARRLYDEGLRLRYEGNGASATRFFMAALAEDSTFGMAAFYAAQDFAAPDQSRATRLLSFAARNAGRAPLRERLNVRHAWALMTNDPVARTIAESLAVNFPTEPQGALALGNSLQAAGAFLAAIPHFERAVALDSAQYSRAPAGVACRPCGPLLAIMSSYMLADSSAAVERSARRLMRFQPRSPAPLLTLADLYATHGRRAEAQALLDSAGRIDPGAIRALNTDIRIALRAGDFVAAERLIRHRLSDVDPEVRRDGLWWLVILQRNRGRLLSADSTAKEFCTAARAVPKTFGSGWREDWCLLARGPVLFELGRYAEAARNYEKLAALRGMSPALIERAPSLLARHLTWMLAHALNAYVYGSDMKAASQLADTVEQWGKLSAYGRDRRLHFHGRGLLAARQGRRDEAISLYRKAIYSFSNGYTRTNLELGRELIAAGRYSEAIAVLRPALAGPIESSNLYVTHTEIHEQMAVAFERGGARDSAAVHYAWVARAWSNADRRFSERAGIAREKAGMERQAIKTDASR